MWPECPPTLIVFGVGEKLSVEVEYRERRYCKCKQEHFDGTFRVTSLLLRPSNFFWSLQHRHWRRGCHAKDPFTIYFVQDTFLKEGNDLIVEDMTNNDY